MRCRSYLLLVILVSLLSACSDVEKITLAAGPGQFEARQLGKPSTKEAFGAALEITKFNQAEKWPTAAYVGFFQGKNRDESVQFLVIRNKPTDNYLVAGYRIIEGGREVKVESLGNVPLTANVSLRMSIDNGLVTLNFLSDPPISFQTSLKEVAPYASVSSGIANVLFRVGP
jgi:hypothetical protein